MDPIRCSFCDIRHSMLNFLQKSSSETTIRVLFWTIGPLIAAVLTYTTRYFINGDAIAYVEMGEALRYGRLWELANLTYSPGYPVLLGLGQILLRTSPLDELELLRVVNFFCFLLAMGSCELLMIFCRREAEALENRNEALLPRPILSLLCYSMFLLAALDWVKVRLLNPDMLVVATIADLCLDNTLDQGGSYSPEIRRPRHLLRNRLLDKILFLLFFRGFLFACSCLRGLVPEGVASYGSCCAGHAAGRITVDSCFVVQARTTHDW